MNPSVAETVRELFVKIMKLPSTEVNMDADLFDAYGVDSLKAVKLLSHLEVEYDILLPDEDVQEIRTLRQVTSVVERLRALPGEQS